MQLTNVHFTMATPLNVSVTVTIGDIVTVASQQQVDLLTALKHMVTGLDTMQITENHITYKGDWYPYPTQKYVGTVPTDNEWKALLADMERMLNNLNNDAVSEPRAYLGICLYRETVLTVEQFNAAYGGVVPSEFPDLVAYGKSVAKARGIDIPEELYDFIDWVALGVHDINNRIITELDHYVDDNWFIN